MGYSISFSPQSSFKIPASTPLWKWDHLKLNHRYKSTDLLEFSVWQVGDKGPSREACVYVKEDLLVSRGWLAAENCDPDGKGFYVTNKP